MVPSGGDVVGECKASLELGGVAGSYRKRGGECRAGSLQAEHAQWATAGS